MDNVLLKRKQRICTIYAILNVVNNKMYIGSSINTYFREKYHLTKLKLGKHPNKHLQFSFNKYGLDNFCFFVLEYCNPIERIPRERFFVKFYKTTNNQYGYNSIEPIDEHFFTNNTGQKISIANKNRCRSNNFKIMLSKKMFGVNNPFFGKVHTEEAKNKISKANKGKRRFRKVKQYSLSGKLIYTFDSIELAFKSLNTNCSYQNFIQICRFKQVYNNFIWEYEKPLKIKNFNKKYKSIIKLDLNKNKIAIYPSISDAALSANTKIQNISNAINRKYKSCGYFWEYVIN